LEQLEGALWGEDHSDDYVGGAGVSGGSWCRVGRLRVLREEEQGLDECAGDGRDGC
jgi:hypothetical protein